MKILDYLYSKSKLKQEHEKHITELTELAKSYARKSNELELRNNKLKMNNHRLQLFIEDNVSEEQKSKFFIKGL